MRRSVFRLGLVASLALTGAGAVAVSGQDAPAGAGAAAGEDAIGVLHVQGKVHMVRLPGDQETNLAVQVGEQGILLVDTGPAAMADRLLATLREHFGDKRIMMLVNTHVHPDHAGGNMALQAAMAAARAAAATGGGGGGRGNNPAIRVMAHENTLNRMNGAIDREEEQPLEAWPTSTFFTKEKELFFNGEPIEIFSVPNAHTDGDVMVFFRGSDVIASGDVFVTNSYPMIDRQRGGSIQGVLDGLNHILDLTVPEFNQQGGTRVIPGHGRLSNEADVDDYRNFMTIIRDRILDLARKGRTLEQVKAAHPTLDFDGVFENPAYAPATFIETVYEEVVKTVNPAAPARPGR